MHIGMKVVRTALAAAVMVIGGTAQAQSGVVYGRITVVNTVTAENAGALTGGTDEAFDRAERRVRLLRGD